MYERIIEIIIYLITEMKDNKNLSEIDISELNERGYSNIEVSTALSWLVDRLEFSEKFYINDETSKTSSFRILHEAEQDLFTTEAWGQLIQLKALGIITNEHIESLIGRSMMMGMKAVDTNQIKFFVANNVFNLSMNSFFGNTKFMLQGNESIN